MPSHAENIALLNKDADKRSVIDSIDRPIRPLVLELTRVGIKTCFSCCGFTYEGEEEPKSHHNTFTYVMFYGPDPQDPSDVSRFFEVVHEFRSNGWAIQLVQSSRSATEQEWHVGFIPPFPMWNPDGSGRSVHDYEGRIFAIQNMVNIFKRWPAALGPKEIVDGNIKRAEFTSEWRVKPRMPYRMVGFE